MSGRSFPYRDDEGQIWLDSKGIYQRITGVCFNCGRVTHRVDVEYTGYFCNSPECYMELQAQALDEQLVKEPEYVGRRRKAE